MMPIVDEVAKRLRDELKANIKDFEGLYVFGSQIRGDISENSDVDIVVLFENNYFRKPRVYYDILSQIDYDYYGVIDLDVMTYTRNELQRNNFFHDEVVIKGVFYGT